MCLCVSIAFQQQNQGRANPIDQSHPKMHKCSLTPYFHPIFFSSVLIFCIVVWAFVSVEWREKIANKNPRIISHFLHNLQRRMARNKQFFHRLHNNKNNHENVSNNTYMGITSFYSFGAWFVFCSSVIARFVAHNKTAYNWKRVFRSKMSR